MYLLNAQEATNALNPNAPAARTTRAVSVEDYSEALLSVTSRVEEALEVDSLRKGVVVDFYDFTVPRNQRYTLRLSNVFLSTAATDAPFISDSDDLRVSLPLTIDFERSEANVTAYRGSYGLTYVAGFDVDSDGVFIGVPDWLKAIARFVLVQDYRLGRGAGQTPNHVSYDAMVSNIRRELFTRISKRISRPRIGVEWPSRSVRRYG